MSLVDSIAKKGHLCMIQNHYIYAC